MEHNFNFTSEEKSAGGKSISVSYIGFTTDDELLAMLEMSTGCEQQIELNNCPGVKNATYWMSLTGDKWWPNQNNDCHRWEIGKFSKMSRF